VSYQVFVPGAALIQVDAGETPGVLVDLGYSRNGVDIALDGFYVNVPGDENGGDEGPPIEVLQLGQTARVRLELTKWDPAVIDVLNSRRWGGGATPGTPPSVGIMMFGGAYTHRLLIKTTSRPFNFVRAFVRGPIEVPQYGSKFATVVCEFECHKNADGVLFNTTTT
jgi:hypothetical protein